MSCVQIIGGDPYQSTIIFLFLVGIAVFIIRKHRGANPADRKSESDSSFAAKVLGFVDVLVVVVVLLALGSTCF